MNTQEVLSPIRISWWASVAVTPLISKITVFKRGTWKGGIITSPKLGQEISPLETGAKLKWKNLQKTLKKNQTSLNKNQTSPHFNAAWTSLLWFPWEVLSRITSRNQTLSSIIAPITLKKIPINETPNLNQNRIILIRRNLPALIPKGHQLLLTKWESCHL